jgi:hypothetical protein
MTGAADDDPSGTITYSMAGAQHGMGAAVARMDHLAADGGGADDVRIGMVTGKGLGEVLTLKFPRAVVVVACCALFMANTINIAADLAGMADAAGRMGADFFPIFFAACRRLFGAIGVLDGGASIAGFICSRLISFAAALLRPPASLNRRSAAAF